MRTGGGALYRGEDGLRLGSDDPWLGRTVRNLAQRLGFLPNEPGGPRQVAKRSAHAQGQRTSPTAPGSRSREGPRQGGEILGCVLGSADHPSRL
jgi:hypothetical protein